MKIGRKISCYVVEFQGRFFFVLSGDKEDYKYEFQYGLFVIESDEENITHDNSGLNTFLWAQDNFPFAQENIGLELIETVFCREGKKNGEFENFEIEKYFKGHYIWEIDIQIHSNINESILYSWFSSISMQSYDSKYFLNYSSKTKQGYRDVIENCPMDLIGTIIYRSMFSRSWNYSFLELYRCIEFLYPIPYLKRFSDRLGDSTLFTKMYIEAENQLDWKPKEMNTLEKLIREYGESNTEILEFKKCFEKVEKVEFAKDSKNSNIVASRIYKLRNSIAHFRLNLSYPISEDNDFDHLIRCMLDLIRVLYDKYRIEVSQIKNLTT